MDVSRLPDRELVLDTVMRLYEEEQEFWVSWKDTSGPDADEHIWTCKGYWEPLVRGICFPGSEVPRVWMLVISHRDVNEPEHVCVARRLSKRRWFIMMIVDLWEDDVYYVGRDLPEAA